MDRRSTLGFLTGGDGLGPDGATTLLGLGGVDVLHVEVDPDGTTTVHVRTDPTRVACCPACDQPAQRYKEQVVTRPRDLSHGGRRVALVWHKRRWYCLNPTCRRRNVYRVHTRPAGPGSADPPQTRRAGPRGGRQRPHRG